MTSAMHAFELDVMEMGIASYPQFSNEQHAINQWQGNCMGQCHYAHAVDPVGSTGPRPITPLADRYSSGMGGAVQDIMQFIGGASLVYGVRPPTTRYSDYEARMKFYIKPEAEMDNLMDPSWSLYEQAEWSFNYRNHLRSVTRYMMADREGAINLAVTEPNFTWEGIIQHKINNKGLSGDDIYLDIINSARKSRPSVNQKLGIHILE